MRSWANVRKTDSFTDNSGAVRRGWRLRSRIDCSGSLHAAHCCRRRRRAEPPQHDHVPGRRVGQSRPNLRSLDTVGVLTLQNKLYCVSGSDVTQQ
eukprot:1303448-Pleurochrysis_carterae.AAC.5